MLKLVSATPSPWARKVRIVMHEKNIPFELINDIPWSADTCVTRYNPLEKLPILLTDGEPVYESRLIAEWLERHFPEPEMIPGDDESYIEVKRIEVLSDSTLDALLLFSMEGNRPHPNAAWADRQRRKIIGSFAELARRIGDRSFAVLERFTLADAAIASVLGIFDLTAAQGGFPGFDWRSEHPALASYFDILQTRDSLQQTVPEMFDFDVSRELHSA